jgi:hypothetical protein
VTRPRDTSVAAWERVERGIAAMTPMQRVQRAGSLTVLAHRMALAQIAREHPAESEREHKLRLAARYIDADLLKAAFDWPRD